MSIPRYKPTRSGRHGVRNLHTPLFIAHGSTDSRVQICQARLYVDEAKRIGKRDLVSYYEMEGVGTRDHFGRATSEQLNEMHQREIAHRESHRTPITLPKQGTLWVHGYLVTKHFSVWLDSLDKVAQLTYDLEAGSYELNCGVPVRYRLVLK